MLTRRFEFSNPWKEMESLQREMNRVFHDLLDTGREGVRAPSTEFPPIRCWTGPEEFRVVVRVPGLKAQDIQVSVLGDTLTLSGERETEQQQEGVHYHRRERGYGTFLRTIELPEAIDSERVEATYRHGLLTFTLPKKAESKPRQITIKPC